MVKKKYTTSVTSKRKTYWYFRRHGKHIPLPGEP